MPVLILRDLMLVDAGHPERSAGFVTHINPLASPASLPEKLLAPVWVCWSGWLGMDQSLDAESVEQDFRTWSREAWDLLNRWCDELLPRLRERGIEVWFRPHCRHILSDPQACLTFFSHRPGQPCRLLFEPAAFLTAAMLASAEDHLERAFAALGAHAATGAVLLSNRTPHARTSESLRASPLLSGAIDPALLARMWQQHVPTGVPLVLLDGELDEQRRLLGLR